MFAYRKIIKLIVAFVVLLGLFGLLVGCGAKAPGETVDKRLAAFKIESNVIAPVGWCRYEKDDTAGN